MKMYPTMNICYFLLIKSIIPPKTKIIQPIGPNPIKTIMANNMPTGPFPKRKITRANASSKLPISIKPLLHPPPLFFFLSKLDNFA